MTEKLPVIAEDRPADEPLEITDEQREKFLALVRANRDIGTKEALFEAGVARTVRWNSKWGNKVVEKTLRKPLTGQQAEDLVRSDPDLFSEYRAARGYGNQQIRNTIVQLGIEGVDRAVYHNGQVVGYERHWETRLTKLAADLWLPEAKALRTGGSDDGRAFTVNVVQKGVSLAEVAAVLRDAGALDQVINGELLAESE